MRLMWWQNLLKTSQKWWWLMGVGMIVGFIILTNGKVVVAEKFDFFESLVLSGSTKKVKTEYNSVAGMINLVVKFITVAAGTGFFILSLVSGYKMVFSGDKDKTLSSVKENLRTGLIGLIIVFAAYWIVELLSKLMPATTGGVGV
jgi:hypothetical protein